MAKIYEEISKSQASGGGKTDSNLANDANHLGGIPAEQYATKKYVHDYHDNKDAKQKEYMDIQDAKVLQEAKEYTNSQIRNQDFSGFAKLIDVQAVDTKLSNKIEECGQNCATNLATQIKAVVDDTNSNFQDVNDAISKLNSNQNNLFQSVSDGKAKVAAAITDKGVNTASDASFDTMAGNIRSIYSGGGDFNENFVNTFDATASASDVLLGKTAYVKGQKVYGEHVCNGVDASDATATPYDILQGKTAYTKNGKVTGLLTISEDTGKPSYDIGGVEKIYGTSANDMTIKRMNTNSLKDTKVLIYHSVQNEPVYLLDFDNNAKQIYVYGVNNYKIDGLIQTVSYSSLNLSGYNGVSDSDDGVYVKSAICTPINYSNSYIALMITDGIMSNSGVRVSLIELKQGAYENGYNLLVFNTDNRNDKDIATSFISSGLNQGVMALSSDNRVLSISFQCENRSYSSNRIHVAYTIYPATLNMLQISNTIQLGGYNVNGSYFICNDKIVVHRGETTYRLIIFNNIDGVVSVGKTISISNCVAVSNDGSFMITYEKDNSSCKLYYNKIYIDYENGSISVLSTTELGIEPLTAPTSIPPYGVIYANNNALLLVNRYENSDTGNEIKLFSINNELLTEISVSEVSLDMLNGINICGMTPDSRFVLLNVYTGFCYLAISNVDYSEVIALKYEGEYFYKGFSKVLTAGQPDVRAGKSFVGWMGYPEIGTMEV